MSESSSSSNNGTGAKKSSLADGSWKDILAGGISGGVTRMLIAPLDVIKIRFQVQSNPAQKVGNAVTSYYYSGVWDSVKTIMRTEGVRVRPPSFFIFNL